MFFFLLFWVCLIGAAAGGIPAFCSGYNKAVVLKLVPPARDTRCIWWGWGLIDRIRELGTFLPCFQDFILGANKSNELETKTLYMHVCVCGFPGIGLMQQHEKIWEPTQEQSGWMSQCDVSAYVRSLVMSPVWLNRTSGIMRRCRVRNSRWRTFVFCRPRHINPLMRRSRRCRGSERRRRGSL